VAASHRGAWRSRHVQDRQQASRSRSWSSASTHRLREQEHELSWRHHGARDCVGQAASVHGSCWCMCPCALCYYRLKPVEWSGWPCPETVSPKKMDRSEYSEFDYCAHAILRHNHEAQCRLEGNNHVH
jgi:hypothetical protein